MTKTKSCLCGIYSRERKTLTSKHNDDAGAIMAHCTGQVGREGEGYQQWEGAKKPYITVSCFSAPYLGTSSTEKNISLLSGVYLLQLQKH